MIFQGEFGAVVLAWQNGHTKIVKHFVQAKVSLDLQRLVKEASKHLKCEFIAKISCLIEAFQFHRFVVSGWIYRFDNGITEWLFRDCAISD